MRILLDTHVWLWTLVDPARLDEAAAEVLLDRANTLYLSAASAWEIAIKYQLGKLPLPEPPEAFIPPRLARDGITPLPVEISHSTRVASLPLHHRDPFDRLIVAQAQLEDLTIYTADAQLRAYDVGCVQI